MRFYCDEEIRRVFTPQRALWAARDAFALLGEGHFVFYPRQVYESPTGFIGQMPGYIAFGENRGFGVKNIVVAKARTKDMPSHNGVVTIFDPDSGMVQAAFDASTITELRTAAMSAFVTDRLAAPKAETLALLGAGDQARALGGHAGNPPFTPGAGVVAQCRKSRVPASLVPAQCARRLRGRRLRRGR